MNDSRGIFECVGGFFVPCLTIDCDGLPRTPDGIRYFASGDIAKRTGVSEGSIQDAYSIFLREVSSCPQWEPESAVHDPILRAKFKNLSDEHFAQYLKICHSKRFNPWGKQVWADTRPNVRTGLPELIVQMTVDGFHAIALRTGEVERIIGPEWCGADRQWHSVWIGAEKPHAARVGIVRRGMAEPLFMVAKWESYAPFKIVAGVKKYDEFWERMPDLMLGKCASCLAIRRAFAEYLDGVYSPEEMAMSRNEVRVRSETAEIPDAPQTSQQFILRLIDLGLGKAAIRNAAIETLRSELPLPYATNLPAFYAAALKRVAESPEKYGAMAMVET